MASGSMGAGSSYVLMGQESELQKHVGHQVEVTGTVDRSMSGGAGSTCASARFA